MESEKNREMRVPARRGANGKPVRTASVPSDAVPHTGGLLSLAAGSWSGKEQDRVNKFFDHWLKMLHDELREKEVTLIEILSRLDLRDEQVKKRMDSPEYKSLVRKTFREWSGAESKQKRIYIRNILANAASTDMTSDDVIRLFLDWINTYSELHFHIVAAIYNEKSISRGEIWRKLGKKEVREDSADADLYKLIIRDLSTGGIIRQARETDAAGNYLKKAVRTRSTSVTLKSAFDESELYQLTNLGQQFVHYAMTELPLKIEVRKDYSEAATGL